MSYNELKQRGTSDFPIEVHIIDKGHIRYEMSSHWHGDIEIIRVIDGNLNIRLNNRSYIAQPGDIVFVNPETVHSAIPENCIYECLVFDISLFDVAHNMSYYFFEGLMNNEYHVREFIPAASPEFHKAVGEVFEIMKNKSSGYKFKVVGSLFTLFGIIIDGHIYDLSGDSSVTADKTVPKLKKVLSYIRSNFDKQISLDDMAQVAEMSSKYFCSFFRNMTRQTPIEYLNTYRIEKASKMLLNTDLSVTDIAFSSGFNDLSYFIKTFKLIKGITPAKYRKGSE